MGFEVFGSAITRFEFEIDSMFYDVLVQVEAGRALLVLSNVY